MPKKNENDTPKNELTMAQRFTNAVVKSYGDVARDIEVTPKQMQLISNYYIKLDEMIKNPDTKIQSWGQVRLPELATTLAHMARLNLDMSLGHLSFIPFKHKDTNSFDLVAIISKDGYWNIAKNYGINPPKSYTIELVYSSDKFSVFKKDATHEYDSYVFEVTNPFNRGNIIGGFGYIEYDDKTNNKIIMMSEQEILKYKPQYAKDAFWTGENRKKMYEKTIAKQLFKRIPLDPDKVNSVQDSFKRIETEEINYTAMDAKNEIDENMCSGDVVDIDFEEIKDVENHVKDVDNLNLFGEEVLPEDDVLR